MSQAGLIDVLAANPTIPDHFPTDAGTAIPVLNELQILGGDGVDTTGVGNVVTINTSGNVAKEYVTDSGTAIPALGILNVKGANGITTTGASNNLTITSRTGAIEWIRIAGILEIMVAGKGYIPTNVAMTTIFLPAPAVAQVGDVYHIAGEGTGKWRLGVNAVQTVHMSAYSSTPGVSPVLYSSGIYDSVTIRCTATNVFTVTDFVGNIGVA